MTITFDKLDSTHLNILEKLFKPEVYKIEDNKVLLFDNGRILHLLSITISGNEDTFLKIINGDPYDESLKFDLSPEMRLIGYLRR